MKRKQLTLLLVFFMMSCKVTEKNVVGIYRSLDGISYGKTLRIDPNGTFLFMEHDMVKKFTSTAPIDSVYYITKGTWRWLNEKVVLNSFASFTDTGRVRSIIQTPSATKESKFTFFDLAGDTVLISRVSSKHSLIAFRFHKQYSYQSLDMTKYDTLKFELVDHSSFVFVKKDDRPVDRVITLAPYFKVGHFKETSIPVKKNRVYLHRLRMKKDRSGEHVPSI